MSRADIVIVGGGVVGLAVAAELSTRFEDVFVLEALPRVGMVTSTRNSGVIHSGLYYPTGSLKARHCLAGNRLLYEYCAKHSVPHRRTGKLIVATEGAEEPQIEALATQGAQNGVERLESLSAAIVRRQEPHIRAVAALRVPSTGLVDPDALVRTLAAQAASLGAQLAVGARVVGVTPDTENIRVSAENVGELDARILINAAGLHADEVARMCGSDNYRIYPCRGEYWYVTETDQRLANELVYPLPSAHTHSLGVHLTRTLEGALLAGPNARYVDGKQDYESSWQSREDFCPAIRKLLPEVRPEDLRRAYSGIRPKLTPSSAKTFSDFIVERDPRHQNIVHLAGIESPGLTAALSLAREVRAMVEEALR